MTWHPGREKMRIKSIKEKVDMTLEAIHIIAIANEQKKVYEGKNPELVRQLDAASENAANIIIQNVMHSMAAIEIIRELDRYADKELRDGKKPSWFARLRAESGYKENIAKVLERRVKRYRKKVDGMLSKM